MKKNEKAKTEEKRVENVIVAPTIPQEAPKIVLHFKKRIDVRINGIKYEGPDIEFTDIKIASEVVRLAKDAYGVDIL